MCKNTKKTIILGLYRKKGCAMMKKNDGRQIMGKKITNVVLFLAVLAAAIGITIYVGQGAAGVMLYNFVFLGIMVLIYLVGLIGGMFQMNSLSAAFERAAEKLPGLFQKKGKAEASELSRLNEIFGNAYLDRKAENFTSSISKSQEGIGDIDEYINEDELDLHIHKRLLEMVPDILTSLGILGTFVGLVWGLKDFQPNDYAAMTTSVSALVDGIKVAFLTSIYGISFSIVYTYGMKSEYSAMTEGLQNFLERFHAYVMPTAENESRNLLLSSQRHQTEAVKQMAEQFSVQMADSFEKVITPTFRKMNDSLDLLTTSVVRCQTDAIKDILDVFLKEMHKSFSMEFHDFSETVEQLKKAQKENIVYTNNLYQTMSRQINDAYQGQEKTIKETLKETSAMQARYMDTASRIAEENRAIQKQQQQDYRQLADFLKDAETSAAKFWVACNQTMQKYVETASQGMEQAAVSGEVSSELLRTNKRIIEDFDAKMKEFVEYQKLSGQTMEQVRRLLSEIRVNGTQRDVSLTGSPEGEAETLEALRQTLEQQGERQEELLTEIAKNMRELSKTAQKGKFGLFR